MNRKNILWNRVTLFTLTLIAVGVSSILFWSTKGFLKDNIYATISNLIVLVSVGIIFYQRRGKLYLLISKYWAILSNQTATWSCSAVFEGDFDQRIIGKCLSIIEKNSSFKYIKESERYAEVFLSGMLIDFTYCNTENADSMEIGNLSIYIKDFQAAYDKTEEFLNQIIVPLFEQLKDTVGSGTVEQYNFKIIFGDAKNPFLTAVFQHAGKKKLLGFQCDFRVEEKMQQTSTFINIGKSVLSITTPSLRRFHELSLNYFGVMGE